MPITLADKDPNSTIDYGIDWNAGARGGWLGEDTITTSTWTVPTGITKVTDSHTTTTTTIWLTGGTVGQTYELTNQIVTAAGRTEDRTIRIKVRNK